MLTSQQQRVGDDVQLFWPVEAEEPPRFESSGFSSGWIWHDQDDLPVALAAGVWLAVALILFGAVLAGLAVVAVIAVGWALWHHGLWVRRVVAPRVTARDTEASGKPTDLPDRYPTLSRPDAVRPPPPR